MKTDYYVARKLTHISADKKETERGLYLYKVKVQHSVSSEITWTFSEINSCIQLICEFKKATK